ncbi:mitotic deacetylase-associated SANT domain protein-like isoform X1 [Paramormyrops kingsleyae]|uniref:mitotic deacetylase-associated SANT domain protein-like isoform X1 n=1 Tax=Paramormyrops kingsleyae TaxID=1676925 RepID=UPI003B97C84D
MSLPPQAKPNAKRTGKRITFFDEQAMPMKESLQQHGGGGGCFGMRAPGSEPPRGDIVFGPDKNEQARAHFQHGVPVKWPEQDPGWPQGIPRTWGQGMGPYMGVSDPVGQVTYAKPAHEAGTMQVPRRAAEKQPNPAEAYRDPAKTRSLEWEQQAPAAMPQVSFPGFPQGHKPGVLHGAAHTAPNSNVLQPFQLAFRPPRQHLTSGYFPTHGAMSNVNYGVHVKEQQQQQQQLQHLRQQQQQQIQQQHMQQQQQQHMQQQQQQHMQQHMQQQQQQQHLLQQQNQQNYLDMYPNAHHTHAHPHLHQQAPKAMEAVGHLQGTTVPFGPVNVDPRAQGPLADSRHPCDMPQLQLRRSRRLSREGDVPSVVLWGQDAPEQPGPRNGAPDGQGGATEPQGAPMGVIQSTRRKRRVSQEANLETLAQKASEMESLPSQVVKQEEHLKAHDGQESAEGEGQGVKRARDDSLLPLVIPVSVPVRQTELELCSGSGHGQTGWSTPRPGQQDPTQPEHKASVIVTRRRSLRNSLSESSAQDEGGKDDDGKSVRWKRRPRPEPLFIPPPKPSSLIAPPAYHNITSYQSHLRSPVRLADSTMIIPPYTPPPILSPVREGSGLYFSTILSSVAASSQGLPPPPTPKTSTRSLLRSTSSDITPPILPVMGEATPVSIEPRINIGQQYQADIPTLLDRSVAQQDVHLADLVWLPVPELQSTPLLQERVNDLMNLACSSAVCGGGTNQELAMHCLHECKGDVLRAMELLLLKNPIFSKTHPLGDYHYSGSDLWTPAERGFFNKGITAYKKDFFVVQKLVRTKTVAQCVEFYYSYKKQVKLGRNGVLIYGEAEPGEPRASDAEVDVKTSQRFDQWKEDDEHPKTEGACEPKREATPARVVRALQANTGEEERKEPPQVRQTPQPPPAVASRPKSGAAHPGKAPLDQEGTFPCKKCGRVFFKVKSRSAHMKSHAEQEKKAAALRQKEAEERAAAQAAAQAAAAAVAAATQQNGARDGTEDSSTEESSEEGEDKEDADWH